MIATIASENCPTSKIRCSPHPGRTSLSCPDFRAAGSDGQVAQIETASPKFCEMLKIFGWRKPNFLSPRKQECAIISMIHLPMCERKYCPNLALTCHTIDDSIKMNCFGFLGKEEPL